MKKLFDPSRYKLPQRLYIRRKLARFLIQVFVWTGLAVLYYLAFSLFFDTPIEYELKKTSTKLEKQYELLSQRYDSLEAVLDNVAERDRNIHRMMFESDPYADETYHENRLALYDKLLSLTNRELAETFFDKLGRAENRVRAERDSMDALQEKMVALGEAVNRIPSIQPVNNKELNKLATSYGLRIHPFYKTMVSHQGVDYALAEDSRVFATADGVVKDINSQSQKGLGVLISHGNGYETYYAALNKVNVRKGEKVRRGDIIALSGNSGLSLAPHLHYEVIYNGMRIDPINYFFYELGPEQYRRIQETALSGMQSLD